MATNLDLPTLISIRVAANGLIGHYGFTEDDREDLQQEVTLQLLERLKGHDPERSTVRTYASRCIPTIIAEIIRARRSPKRRCAHGYVSLNADRPGEQRASDRLTADIAEQRSRDQERQTELQEDLAAAQADLNDRQRDLLLRLPGRKVAELAREMGVSRQRIHEEIAAIRVIFRRHGLDQYLIASGQNRGDTHM